MSIQVNEFYHIPGKNDAEYIKLLKEHLEAQKQLTFKAIAKIKELSKSAKSNSSESPNGWISCDEQLPEEGVIVWVSSDNEIWLLRRYGINWYQSGGNWALLTKEIDAWMPIVVPEPYQPKEDANG